MAISADLIETLITLVVVGLKFNPTTEAAICRAPERRKERIDTKNRNVEIESAYDKAS